MTSLDVDGTTFVFSSGWKASNYDEWVFFKKKFAVLNAKALDIVALSPEGELHLIEVKDYSHPETVTVPLEDLPMTVAAKCRDTLGGLAAARLGALEEEKHLSIAALKAPMMRITLHIDLPKKKGRLSNPKKLIADLQMKLRMKVKAIDPHARVENRDTSEMWSTHRTV